MIFLGGVLWGSCYQPFKEFLVVQLDLIANRVFLSLRPPERQLELVNLGLRSKERKKWGGSVSSASCLPKVLCSSVVLLKVKVVQNLVSQFHTTW